jgi:Fur family iron response transcriptional regulator
VYRFAMIDLADHVIDRLHHAGLRPTRQRVALARSLFAAGHRHVTAEQLHRDVTQAGITVSLATVYNTLHHLTRAGYLSRLVIGHGHSYFDTNTHDHHHFFHEATGRLEDIDSARIQVLGLPPVPEGMVVAGIHVIVRINEKKRESP